LQKVKQASLATRIVCACTAHGYFHDACRRLNRQVLLEDQVQDLPLSQRQLAKSASKPLVLVGADELVQCNG
jgi:hypothetical protein